jgi:glutamine synthetase
VTRHGDHDLRGLSSGKVDFVERNRLWSDEQKSAGERLLRVMSERRIDAVRVSFADIHGILRGKTVTARAFESVLRNGIDCSSGPYFFDTGLDLVGDLFVPGAGHGIDELTGAADFVLVPDPSTFRVLPWTEGVTGWVLADEYFKSGRPVPLSARHLLKRLTGDLGARNLALVAGIEIEWYLTRVIDPVLSMDAVGGWGQPGQPPVVAPVNLGYQFNSELYGDQLDPVLHKLRTALEALEMPLRTTEHESGPGQLEFTFDPQHALEAADGVLLFRSAVKQVCARSGYHASFMCRPGLEGFDASGWHLHQSLFTDGGQNAFMSSQPEHIVSDLARSYAGGLLEHAGAASVLTTPTINGYARAAGDYILAPDRACWSVDNRGTYIRVLGEPGDPSTHLENRGGEPAANPYLYLASQLIAGLDGVDRKLDPGPLRIDPHTEDAPALPSSLSEAVVALKADTVFRERAGNELIDYLVRVKENELGRYERALAELGPTAKANSGGVSDWEQREYFRMF